MLDDYLICKIYYRLLFIHKMLTSVSVSSVCGTFYSKSAVWCSQIYVSFSPTCCYPAGNWICWTLYSFEMCSLWGTSRYELRETWQQIKRFEQIKFLKRSCRKYFFWGTSTMKIITEIPKWLARTLERMS